MFYQSLKFLQTIVRKEYNFYDCKSLIKLDQPIMYTFVQSSWQPGVATVIVWSHILNSLLKSWG